MKSSVLAAMLMAVTLNTACRKTEEQLVLKTPVGPLPFGALDVPRPGAVVRGGVSVGGWALAESGIEDVALYIDRNFMSLAITGGDRPDVAKLFPGFPDSKAAGWNSPFDASTLPAGEHELIVQARAKNGAVRDLGSIRIVVRP